VAVVRPGPAFREGEDRPAFGAGEDRLGLGQVRGIDGQLAGQLHESVGRPEVDLGAGRRRRAWNRLTSRHRQMAAWSARLTRASATSSSSAGTSGLVMCTGCPTIEARAISTGAMP
jgi:hypothetical protein